MDGMAPEMNPKLKEDIENLWAQRDTMTDVTGPALVAVREAVEMLNRGTARVAEIGEDGQVIVHEWLKCAILLFFKVAPLRPSEAGPLEFVDKIPLKTGYEMAGVRVVPGASARWGSFIGRGVVLMPSYVNIGAYVGAGTMVDTWATVGSCAQVGENVHLAGGVGIGGVLEPPQASPVIIEDNAFIGSRCIVVEGARVGKGSVLGAGLVLSSTIPVIDAESGEELSRGHVPAWSVAVSATRPRSFPGGEYGLPCALVIKRLEEGQTHDKAQLNEILRAHSAAV